MPWPSGASVDPAEEKARTLGELVSGPWEELGRPCSEVVADQALRFAERRAAAFDLERCVVVHGDPHPANALQILAPRPGAESGYVFVDPDGFLADPTCDLGVVLRHWCPELLAEPLPDLHLSRRAASRPRCEQQLEPGEAAYIGQVCAVEIDAGKVRTVDIGPTRSSASARRPSPCGPMTALSVVASVAPCSALAKRGSFSGG